MVEETPDLFQSIHVQTFMEQELNRGSKQWIHHIIAGTQEKEQVILKSEEFILLPDTERVNRYGRLLATPSPQSAMRHCKRYYPTSHPPRDSARTGRQVLNWLAIVTEPGIRSLRDLRGCHVHCLRTMLSQCMESIEAHTGIKQEQIMAYVHYPPSVYQLHVHFSYPYGQYCHRDTYRVHSVQSIINNLLIDGDYYDKCTLQLAMFRHSPHFAAVQLYRSERESGQQEGLLLQEQKNRNPIAREQDKLVTPPTDHACSCDALPLCCVLQGPELGLQ